jgi:hypothetical protein
VSYGPENCLNDLNRFWDETASEDEQASLEFYLLDVVHAEGTPGVTRLLQGFPSARLGTITVSESAGSVLHTVSREGRLPLLIATCDEPDMAWVNVAVESAPRSEEWDNPRHEAFYTIWEKFLGDDPEKENIPERSVFLIGLLESEVMNGGFGQYLTNTDGVYLSETLECLERIGACKAGELLRAAIKLADRSESYVAAWDDAPEAFSLLDDEFYDSSEDLAGLTADRFLDI